MPSFYEVELTITRRTHQRIEAVCAGDAFSRARKGHPGWTVASAREILQGNGEPKPDDQLGPVIPNLNSDQPQSASAAA